MLQCMLLKTVLSENLKDRGILLKRIGDKKRSISQGNNELVVIRNSIDIFSEKKYLNVSVYMSYLFLQNKLSPNFVAQTIAFIISHHFCGCLVLA